MDQICVIKVAAWILQRTASSRRRSFTQPLMEKFALLSNPALIDCPSAFFFPPFRGGKCISCHIICCRSVTPSPWGIPHLLTSGVSCWWCRQGRRKGRRENASLAMHLICAQKRLEYHSDSRHSRHCVVISARSDPEFSGYLTTQIWCNTNRNWVLHQMRELRIYQKLDYK